MISKILRQALGLAAPLLLAACAAVPPAPARATAQAPAQAAQPVPVEIARPAMWALSDEDTTIYLLGTIHLLPPNTVWRTPVIDRAIADSDSLIIETIIDPDNPAELIQALMILGRSPGLPPLVERIDPARRPALQAAIAKSGMPPAVFDQMETWTAAFTLLGVKFKEIGIAGQHGVEETLRNLFSAAGKPIGQLETNMEQLGYFDTLPESAQLALLEGAIETSDDISMDFDAMLKSWASGDVDAIAETFNRSLAPSPELREALLERRNANWSRWIVQRLDQPGTVLLAVGAGHLAGDDSVQAMLEAKGYRVRRVQ
ncbi:MAG TPA: TraB/GumN family protein [Sphingomicrobium sp.]|nr:TraB/GumN family protein [Sphingomicrobium sp.]